MSRALASPPKLRNAVEQENLHRTYHFIRVPLLSEVAPLPRERVARPPRALGALELLLVRDADHVELRVREGREEERERDDGARRVRQARLLAERDEDVGRAERRDDGAAPRRRAARGTP